ncbi:hypothetical protein CC79DRAFT_1332879 [Sarocladium strictum]
MPTATTVGMLSLNNLGALTTTFSAPSSCATVPGWQATGIANPDMDSLLILPVDGCGGPIDLPEQCLPHGDKISEQWESLHTGAGTILNYYSPGLHCPNDWATVGVYTAGQESNDTTATGDGDLGIFSPTAFNNGRPGQSTSFPYADFSANMFTSALEPSETAVICCPSGFGIDPYGACYSNIPISELAGKSACWGQATGDVEPPNENERETITWGFWGDSTTVTRHVYDFPTATDYYSTVTVTLDDDGIPETGVPLIGRLRGEYDDDDLKGIVAVSPLYLVHRGEDGDGSGGNGGGNENEDENEDGDGNDEDEGSDEEGSNEDDDDNAAGHLSPTTGVFAAGFSFAAGLGLLIAW